MLNPSRSQIKHAPTGVDALPSVNADASLANAPPRIEGSTSPPEVITCLLHEHYLSISEAAKRLRPVRGNKSPNCRTLYRWADGGLRSRRGNRVYLETARIGGTNCTSIEALIRFFDRLNDPEPSGSSKNQSQVTREKEATVAIAILQQRGLLK